MGDFEMQHSLACPIRTPFAAVISLICGDLVVQLDLNCGGTTDVVGREEFSYASPIPKSPKKMVASWELFKRNIPKD